MSAPTRIVLLGGGYVTLHAYAAIARRMHRDIRRGRLEVVVISADHAHRFHGFTGELVAGAIRPERTVTPLTEILPLARVIIGDVVEIDPDGRAVSFVAREDGLRHEVPFDHVVVGTGAREPVATIPGLAEHGCTLRRPGDIDALARRLAARPGAHVVVAGGGVAGAELAAAIADRGCPVTLAHTGDRVMTEWDDVAALPARAARELERSGVDVRTGTRVVHVEADRAALSDGTTIRCGIVVGTVGQAAVVIPGLDELRDDRGRLRTRSDLSVAPGVWSGGDAAAVAHPATGVPVPANALWAIKSGGHIGRAVVRQLRGRPAGAFAYRGLGRAASFGIGRGVAELYGIPLTGALAWTVRLGFFLRFMPSRRRAVGVIADLLRGARGSPPEQQELSAPAAARHPALHSTA